MPAITTTKVFNEDFLFGQTKILFVEIYRFRGWSELDTLLYSVSEYNPNKLLKFEFSYSLDCVNFSEFTSIEIGQENNINLELPLKNDFWIKLRCTREGTDEAGVLTLNSITIEGNFEQEYFDIFSTDGTVFRDIKFNDVRWNELWLNLFLKMYGEGVLPEFMDRGADETFSLSQDEDFIAWYKSFCYFFALIFILAENRIDNFYENPELMYAYLTAKNIFLCQDNSTLEQIKYIANNTYDQIRQRGTINISKTAEELEMPVDGELRRLFCWLPTEEFLFEFIPRNLRSWYVDRTSPTFYRLTGHIQLNKTGFNEANATGDSVDALGLGDVSIVTEDGRQAYQLDTDAQLVIKTVTDYRISYEITFWTKQESSSLLNLTIQSQGTEDILIPKIADDFATDSDEFFVNVDTSNYNDWTFVRAVLYRYNLDEMSSEDARISIGYGKHLVMKEFTYLSHIYLSNTGTKPLLIWDLKFTPLLNYLNASIVDATHQTLIFVLNKSQFSAINMKEIILRYLIPHSSQLLMNVIGDTSDGVGTEKGDYNIDYWNDFFNIGAE